MRFFRTPEERDSHLEGTYRYDRKGYHSTLAYVAGEQEALIRAFRQHWDGNGEPEAALLSFELEHFGAALELVAHGILVHALRQAMRDGLPAERRAKVPPRQAGEAAEDYIKRIAVTNGWMQPGAEAVKEMPAAPGEESAA